MPPDRRRIEQDLGAEQAGNACRLRVPLIPADQNANVGVAGFPDAETSRALVIAIVGNVRISGREIELLVEKRIVGDVHLAIRAEKRSRSEEHTSELQSHLNLVCRL